MDFSEIEKDEYVSSVEFSDSDIEKQIKNNYLTVVMKFLISDEIYNLDEINSN
ncbi:MAG: hypothetical protein ACOC1S_01055 [bacterium]